MSPFLIIGAIERYNNAKESPLWQLAFNAYLYRSEVNLDHKRN